MCILSKVGLGAGGYQGRIERVVIVASYEEGRHVAYAPPEKTRISECIAMDDLRKMWVPPL